MAEARLFSRGGGPRVVFHLVPGLCPGTQCAPPPVGDVAQFGGSEAEPRWQCVPRRRRSLGTR